METGARHTGPVAPPCRGDSRDGRPLIVRRDRGVGIVVSPVEVPAVDVICEAVAIVVDIEAKKVILTYTTKKKRLTFEEVINNPQCPNCGESLKVGVTSLKED